MEAKKTSNKFSPEVRERAVRLVLEHQGDYASQWTAMASIASKIGCTGETLRSWFGRRSATPGNERGFRATSAPS